MTRYVLASVCVFVALGVAVGCATGTDDTLFEGAGGSGGAGTSTSTSHATSSTSTTATTSSTTTGSASSSSTTSTGSGGGCDASEHLCSGVCVGNTPQTGCFQSASCQPCPPPPVNAMTTCSAAGQCDFACTFPYVKNGASCVCSQQCCSDADCQAGSSCTNGSCSGGGSSSASSGGGSCDDVLCFLDCAAQGCLGGSCNGNNCECFLC